ncbi:hypothetical protein COY13_00315 [Candidatus Roizmanbacteria bacterium CG_4_10_14_0_2_um_filter_36_35]|uniref:Rod shape-determining protein MreD n=4 Tax=Candidatus Roizmaniibacteriota TaxID=1752723 RepID=A0A2M7BY30_9BACT|nr:MAG: hypothetical protein COV86_03450 [Candidatus Roizmanbacteria bacterium CG11_big_fil_rev_8_21_14_0_20_35_14]PIV11474.1 MAG: hypothetical protein COS50_00015 [Candidatus Roizmanbacteria bacterium CG03_land_8_20_14_0_80_35_26]PIZ68875.1 MAG: hypothetical protein COY13_00315 [Candidatus Roizmanbacteria bacterium CG_4_10_14_0_2_um_filter_36_35]PJC31099.1 MAG: hypothetical protein CO049_04600 [Candidatus Roizmanbacteria bacterium CG_4_9_14_0_2_um_filter_36_12]PJC79814.1 MAG: hypothetical prot
MAVVSIILLAVVARLVPHPPNFAPIGGLALFSGSHFKKKIALLIPLAAMLISDVFLGFHNTMIYVYASFFLAVLIGRLIKNNRWRSLALASLTSSVLFFLITNFGVWLSYSMYPKTLAGLFQSYLMGLPFFRNTILSDFFYTFSFFYGYQFLSNLSLAHIRGSKR